MAIFKRKTSRRDALVKKAKAAVKQGGKVLMKGAKAAAKKGGKALGRATGRARVRLARAAKDFRSEARRAGRKRKVKQAVSKARKALKSAGEVAMAVGTVAMNRMRAGKKARRRRQTPGPRMVR